MLKSLIFTLLSLICSTFCLAAEPLQPLVIPPDFSSAPLTSRLAYLEDTGRQLDFETVRRLEDSAWTRLPAPATEDINFGFSDSSYWIQFRLQNPNATPQELLLHLDYALLDSIDLYALNQGQRVENYRSGDLLPFSERPIPFPTFVFPLSLDPGEGQTIYLRVASSGPLQIPLSLWDKSTFLIEQQSYQFAYGAFLSALLIMSAYNLFLFFIVRSRSYLLYSVFILCMAGVHGSLDGFTYQWFWPELSGWHQVSAVVFISVGLLFTVLFTRSVLPIPRKSKLRVLIRVLTYTALLSVLVTVFLPYRFAAMLNATMTVLIMAGVCFTCVAMLWHSPRIARLYCAAWGIYFFGIMLKSLSKMGYAPHNAFTEHAGNIGGVIGVVVISLALADRINSEKRAKEKAQKQSISHLKRFENLYEQAVEGIFSFDLRGRLLAANPAFLNILGLPDVEAFNQAYSASPATDLKPTPLQKLIHKVSRDQEVVNHELQLPSRSGESIWANVSARLSHDELHSMKVVEGTLIDITDRKAFEAQLVHLASHDSLTGFFNRRAFEERAKEKLEAVQQYQEPCCLLYLDLDQFKIVNDLCGHTAGDTLLKNLSQRLIENLHSISEAHTIARLGGDEFGILLADTGLTEAQRIAETLRASIESFLFVWDGNRFSLGVSIGLVELCPFHHSVEQILVMADTACYKAKDQGRNRVYTFIETDKELQFRQLEMQWVATIKEAIQEDHFFLVFQHIAPNTQSSGALYHYELLLRLMSPQGNLCSPGQFLPAAERYNLMPNIDRWVVESYFRWLSSNPAHRDQLENASINLSTQSIGDEMFLDFLVNAFERYQIPGSKICFEITESMAISNLDNTHAFISRMKKLGCRFSLDDFGTGFSSYAYLRDLNVDYIKIDGVFIRNLSEDPVNAAMVRSISDVARAMGIETVAEFVESEEIRLKLIDIGITYSQGYHIHKPCQLEAAAFASTVG